MKTTALIIGLCFSFAVAETPAADDFYKGKTIRVIVGGTAGGGFDVYTRAMTRYMGKHIRGRHAYCGEIYSQRCETGWPDLRHLQRLFDSQPGPRPQRFRF